MVKPRYSWKGQDLGDEGRLPMEHTILEQETKHNSLLPKVE